MSDRSRPASTAVEMIGERPAGTVLRFVMALHVLLWTLTPALVHTGLPLDVVEAYAIAQEWVIGFHKHPALPYWVLEASRMLTGAIGWPAYVLSAACVATTMWLVCLLARDMVSERRAASAALLLSGVIYFNWVTPEFNHNVALMPAWMAVILALWRARTRDSLVWWLALAVAAAAATYIKLSSALLLAPAAIYIVCDARCRAALRTRSPWLGLALYALLIAPLGFHLVQTNFAMLAYAETRALGKSDGVLLFFVKQMLSVAPLFALAAAALLPLRHVKVPVASSAASDDRQDDALRFVATMHAAPVLLLMLGAALAGIGLKGSWGAAMASLNGLLVVLLADRFRLAMRDGRVVAGAVLITLLVPAAYAVTVVGNDGRTRTPQRVNWPQAEIAAHFEAAWRRQTGAPLRIVIGDVWTAGLVAVHATSRPSLFIDGNPQKSPWIDGERLARDGALVVWWWPSDRPPDRLAPLLAGRTFSRHQVSIPVDRLGATPKSYAIDLHYAIVPPRASIAR